MLYIISEDSVSGFRFWKAINYNILESKAYVDHSGETRIYDIIKRKVGKYNE